jgi:hypothetical protein
VSGLDDALSVVASGNIGDVVVVGAAVVVVAVASVDRVVVVALGAAFERPVEGRNNVTLLMPTTATMAMTAAQTTHAGRATCVGRLLRLATESHRG